jgi:hypothetical protein
MNRGFMATILTITCLIMIFGAFQVYAQQAADANPNVLNVNGTMISQAQFQRELATEINKSAGQSMTEDELKAKIQKVLEKITKNELLYQECQKNNIDVAEEDINKKFDTERDKFASEEEYLKNYNTDSTVRKTEIKRDLAIQKLINQKITSTINIEDKDIEKYYKENPDLYKNNNKSLEDSKEEIKKKLKLEKIADGYNKFYTEVKSKAKVEYLVK